MASIGNVTDVMYVAMVATTSSLASTAATTASAAASSTTATTTAASAAAFVTTALTRRFAHGGHGTGATAAPGVVSPVTLSSDWSRVARLLLLVSLAVVGSIGNVFMISAVMIEDHLKKRGNTFVVNVALADLVITGLVIPASAVVLLAGVDGSLAVCRFQWFLAVVCFLVTVLTLASIAAENYARLCCGDARHRALTPSRITCAVLAFWTLCSVASGMQFAFDISFDYCTRKTPGLLPYQATVGVLFVFMPVFLTFICYVRIVYRVRAARARPSFKPPITFNWDVSLMRTNMYSFACFVVFWLPFGVVLAVGSTRTIPDSVFYNVAWIALSRSCVNNLLYCVTNRHFRNAYVNLFHYCCCKTTVSFSRRQRGDVRVHIIPGYNMYSYTSPQRSGRDSCGVGGGGGGGGGASCRPCGSVGMSGGGSGSRNVYEL